MPWLSYDSQTGSLVLREMVRPEN